MANTATFYQVVDPSNPLLSFYVKPDNATIGDGETKELIVQGPALDTITLYKRTLELSLPTISEAQAAAILTRVEQTLTELLDGTYTAFNLLMGAYTLRDVRATSSKPVVPEIINGKSVYVDGFSITYSSSVYD